MCHHRPIRKSNRYDEPSWLKTLDPIDSDDACRCNKARLERTCDQDDRCTNGSPKQITRNYLGRWYRAHRDRSAKEPAFDTRHAPVALNLSCPLFTPAILDTLTCTRNKTRHIVKYEQVTAGQQSGIRCTYFGTVFALPSKARRHCNYLQWGVPSQSTMKTKYF